MRIEGLVQYLISPFNAALLLAGAAGLLWMARRQRVARMLAVIAAALLWVSSLPAVALALEDALVSGYPPRPPQDLPSADAIVVLGGAMAGARFPDRPTLALGAHSTRIWYASALYRAGKAPKIVVAAGNRPEQAGDQVEADAIAELLGQLGVPPQAIVLERASQTTRENAAYVLPVLRKAGARKVLLVTSAEHMPRAVATFDRIWAGQGPVLVPAPAGGRYAPLGPPWELWLPSLPALLVVTSALKEFAGTVGLAIIQ